MMTSTHFCQASKTVLLTMGSCEFAFEAFGNPHNPWQRTGHLCKLPSSVFHGQGQKGCLTALGTAQATGIR